MDGAETVDVVGAAEYMNSQEQAWQELVGAHPDLEIQVEEILKDHFAIATYRSPDVYCTDTMDVVVRNGILAISEVLGDGVARNLAYYHPTAVLMVGMTITTTLQQVSSMGNVHLSIRPMVVGVAFERISCEMYPSAPANGRRLVEGILGIPDTEADQCVQRFKYWTPTIH